MAEGHFSVLDLIHLKFVGPQNGLTMFKPGVFGFKQKTMDNGTV